MAILLNVKDCDDKIKLESFIKKNFKHLVKSNVYKLIRTGQIRVNGGRRKANTILNAGDSVRFPPFIEMSDRFNIEKSNDSNKNKSFLNNKLEIIKNNILFEDNNIIAINKPEGFASQMGSGVSFSMDQLVNLIDNNSFRLVHRLDKDTSGVMVFAKNLKVAREWTLAFKNQQIQKTYLAICYGIFEKKSGLINNDIFDGDKVLPAVTKYKVLAEYKNCMSFVELQPKNGRKHQLRIHLSQVGHAIVGDRLHSTLKQLTDLYLILNLNCFKNNMNRLYLHAFNIKSQDHLYDISAPIFGKFLDFLKTFFEEKNIKQYIKI